MISCFKKNTKRSVEGKASSPRAPRFLFRFARSTLSGFRPLKQHTARRARTPAARLRAPPRPPRTWRQLPRGAKRVGARARPRRPPPRPPRPAPRRRSRPRPNPGQRRPRHTRWAWRPLPGPEPRPWAGRAEVTGSEGGSQGGPGAGPGQAEAPAEGTAAHCSAFAPPRP